MTGRDDRLEVATVDDGTARPELGVGMVGYGFMGAAHSHAWRTAARVLDLDRKSVV